MAIKFLSEQKLNVVLTVFVFLSLLTLSGNADAKDVTAASCSAADIQAAVDAVKKAGGGTVQIPAGKATHSTTIKLPDGISLIGAGQNQTFIANADIRINTKFYGKLDKSFRVSGLRLNNNSYLEIRGCSNFRVDHITIERSSGSSAISIQESYSGLIDHCIVRVTGPFYGIGISQGYKQYYPEDWEPEVEKLLGKSTAIFIEDSDFYGCHHAIVGHGNAHYVARWNSFQDGNAHQIDTHGPGYGPPCGTRLVEVYNNSFNYSPDYTWKAIAIRGGDAVIFNNVFKDYDNATMLTLESKSEGPHPVPMQVRNTWIWDNTIINLGKNHEERCPGNWKAGDPHCNEVLIWDINQTPMASKDYIRENQEYYLRKPTQEQDGFTYKPYTYPHPFQSGLPNAKLEPDAPKNLRLSSINGLL